MGTGYISCARHLSGRRWYPPVSSQGHQPMWSEATQPHSEQPAFVPLSSLNTEASAPATRHHKREVVASVAAYLGRVVILYPFGSHSRRHPAQASSTWAGSVSLSVKHLAFSEWYRLGRGAQVSRSLGLEGLRHDPAGNRDVDGRVGIVVGIWIVFACGGFGWT